MGPYQQFFKMSTAEEAEIFITNFVTKEASTYLDLTEFFKAYDIREFMPDGAKLSDKYPQDPSLQHGLRFTDRLVHILMYRWKMRKYRRLVFDVIKTSANAMVSTLMMESEKMGVPMDESQARALIGMNIRGWRWDLSL